jgi:hypothetical protein
MFETLLSSETWSDPKGLTPDLLHFFVVKCRGFRVGFIHGISNLVPVFEKQLFLKDVED